MRELVLFKTQNPRRNERVVPSAVSWQIGALLTDLNGYVDSLSCALEGKKSFAVAVTLERGRVASVSQLRGCWPALWPI